MIRTSRPDALSVHCPWCGAVSGQWCEKVFSTRRGKQAVTFFVHPSRSDTASGRGGYTATAMGPPPDALTRPGSGWLPDPDPQF